MLRITLFSLSLAFFLSACSTVITCEEFFECGASYTYLETGFCPNGYLFLSESGEKIFVDYFAYPAENIEETFFQELKEGDKVSLDFEVIDQNDWIYHLIDYACEEDSKMVPDVDKWVMATCLSTVPLEPSPEQ